MKQLIYLSSLLLLLSLVACSSTRKPIIGSFIDERDQEVYTTVRINNQTWMVENLRYKVPSIPTLNKVDKAHEEAYMLAIPTAPKVFGRYYDFATAMNFDPKYINEWNYINVWESYWPVSNVKNAQGICPSGWRLPTYEDFVQIDLDKFLLSPLDSLLTPNDDYEELGRFLLDTQDIVHFSVYEATELKKQFEEQGANLNLLYNPKAVSESCYFVFGAAIILRHFLTPENHPLYKKDIFNLIANYTPHLHYYIPSTSEEKHCACRCIKIEND